MKARVQDLAVFGGPRAFEESLPVGRPNIGDRGRLFARLNDLLDRRWLTNRGPYVQELEERIAALAGVRHCIATCNGTVALEIAVRALGMTGEVIVPSFTFIATAHALQWQEITPVFCDVDPRTHNLDPRHVEALITPRTTGIIGVHLWGRPCEVEALEEIALRRELRLLFDAAHAFGCTRAGRPAGSFGNAEVFSFHATKFLNAFEGGAVVTGDDDLAARIRLMKNFGFADYDEVVYVGTNGKMDEASAAMALTSLESMEEFIAANRRNYRRYRQGLAGVPGVRLLEYDETERNNYQYIVLEVDEASAGLGRDLLQRVLWAENVLARRYFYPGCHRMEPYRSYFPHAGLLLPVTERLVLRVLTLPTGTAVDEDQIAEICGVIRLAVAHGNEIAARLREAVPQGAGETR
ncbi:MAG TPA: aminotransferase class I/II-fold pyridoxal phosphate-dependent enzyme [Thermoanaerobaculia bacterium]|jgi:dTDP-4-dehydro-6-deoxyglucose aminotransferase|nr:aminotransferase class I/II-fold pyridoxal phosphate-dependent enzyme [Thermoanaerobaculia bacterium]